MSTISARPSSAATVPAKAMISVRRGLLLAAVAAAGLLVAIGAGLLLATSDHLVDPTAYGLTVAVTVVGWFSAALYWLVRRPGNRLGLFLLALAVALAAVSLQGATQPHLRSIGVLANAAVFLLVFYVILAFPEGRIASRFGWALLGAMSLETLVSYVPTLLFSPVVYGRAPLAGCNAACPENGFMIADRPTLADGFFSSDITAYYLLAAFSAFFVYLIYRLATATRPRRRALLPVYVPVLMSTVAALALYGVLVERVHVDASTLSKVGWLSTIGYSAIPYGFLLSIVVSTFFAATALKMIVSRLVESPSAAQLRTTLADALDDPSLELGFRLEQAGGFVDSSGKPLASTPPAGQSSTPVTQNGETVAVIMHDAALDTDPELVAAAGQALLLAIENGRLTAELQSTNTELRATRARILATGEAERRKIERDLHDGAQQHLIALSMRVGLAREIADPEVAQRLDDVGKELDEILEELRDLAHGLYPSVLRDFGLRDALASVVRRSAPPAKLEAAAIGRYAEDVEAAVYFCCVESLQNAAKHAGSGTTAVIRLWQRDGRLDFEIVDDGAGFDVESARGSGNGYTNMTDRMASRRRHALRRFRAWAGHGGPRKRPGRPPDAFSSSLVAVCLQLFREVLERFLRLGLLLTGEVDALLRQERSRFGGDLERLRGRAFRRQLEDHGVVGVEPKLGDEFAGVALRRELQLEHRDRAENREIVQLEPLGCVRRVQRPLLLGVELADRPLPQHRIPDIGCLQRALHRSRANEPARHCVDLDAEVRRAAQLGRQLLRDNRAQLHDRIVALSLDTAGTDDDAALVERQLRRVEEVDLPNLSVERIHPERRRSAAPVGHRHRQLELDAVGAFRQRDQLGEILIGERGGLFLCCGGHGCFLSRSGLS